MTAAEKDHWTLKIPKPKRAMRAMKSFGVKHQDTLINGFVISVVMFGIAAFYYYTILLMESRGVADLILNLTPRHLVTLGAVVAGVWTINKFRRFQP